MNRLSENPLLMQGISICAVPEGYEQCQLFLGMHAWEENLTGFACCAL